jgi:hypothetical protein
MVRAIAFVVAAFAVLAARADPPHARKPSAPTPPAPDTLDPLEQLGVRLAERLGAERAENGDGFVLRVPARDAAAKPTPAAPAKRPTRRVDC